MKQRTKLIIDCEKAFTILFAFPEPLNLETMIVNKKIAKFIKRIRLKCLALEDLMKR